MKKKIFILIISLVGLLTGCGESKEIDMVKNITFESGVSVESLIKSNMLKMRFIDSNKNLSINNYSTLDNKIVDSINKKGNGHLLAQFVLTNEIKIPDTIHDADLKYEIDGKTNSGYIIKVTDLLNNCYAKIPVSKNGDYREVSANNISYIDTKNKSYNVARLSFTSIVKMINNSKKNESKFIFDNIIDNTNISLTEVYLNNILMIEDITSFYDTSKLYHNLKYGIQYDANLEDYIVMLFKIISMEDKNDDMINSRLNSHNLIMNYHFATLLNFSKEVAKNSGSQTLFYQIIKAGRVTKNILSKISTEESEYTIYTEGDSRLSSAQINKLDISKSNLIYSFEKRNGISNVIWVTNNKTGDKILLGDMNTNRFINYLEYDTNLEYHLKGEDRPRISNTLSLITFYGFAVNKLLNK